MMGKSFGFIETRGFLGLAGATDAMNKAAAVEFVRQEHIGSGYVTSIVTGEVGAVYSAVEAGRTAANEIGSLIHGAVIPQLDPQAESLCLNWILPEPVSNAMALGLIETQGFVPMILAADAASKSTDVILTNYFVIGSGYSIVALRGDVAAIRQALEAGKASAGQVGKVVSAEVIPRPHLQLEAFFSIGGKPGEGKDEVDGSALGFMETRGLTALIVASDAAVKAARVVLVSQQRIGSGIVSAVVKGDVAAVRSAVSAGRSAGERVGEFLTANVVAFPPEAVIQANSGGR